MTKIKNTVAYPRDITISDEDYIIGSDGDTSDKKTKNYFFKDIRDYLLAGLAPEVGGTLKVTEIAYTGVLTTPSGVANVINPNYNVLQYNVVIFSVNGDKYLLKLQNITIGITGTQVEDTDFITINANFKLGDGINLYKGFNASTGKEEHYALKSVGLGVTLVGDNVMVEQTEETKLGSGVHFYKGFNATTKKQEYYGFTSNDHILTLVDNNYVLSNPLSGVPRFIVNSSYSGDEELGTEAKPFKNLQNALDAYVGNGASNKVPQFEGNTIEIQEDDNEFIGCLLYKGLKLVLISGAILTSNPADSNYLLDVDSEAVLPSNPEYSMLAFGNSEQLDITIDIQIGAEIKCKKEGIKNRGTNTMGGNFKIVRFPSLGLFHLDVEPSVASPSVRRLFTINADNQTGFVNSGVVANFIVSSNCQSDVGQIAYVGLNGKFYINDNVLQFGKDGVPFNSGTVPLQINGGIVIADNVQIVNYYNNSPTYSLVNLISLETESTVGGSFTAVNSKIGENCEYVFSNLDAGATTENTVSLDQCTYSNVVDDAYFKNFMSSGLWEVKLVNCNINEWGVDETKVSLIPNTINTLGNQVVETLTTYASRATAVSNGLFKDCKFINENVITAGAFVVGIEYKIATVGDTDFTLIGASANTVGLYFIASGVGVGTGTASASYIDIVI